MGCCIWWDVVTIPSPQAATQHGWDAQQILAGCPCCALTTSTALQHEKQQEILAFFTSAKEKHQYCQGGISPFFLCSLRSSLSSLPWQPWTTLPSTSHPEFPAKHKRLQNTVSSSLCRKNIPVLRELSSSQLDLLPTLDKKDVFPVILQKTLSLTTQRCTGGGHVKDIQGQDCWVCLSVLYDEEQATQTLLPLYIPSCNRHDAATSRSHPGGSTAGVRGVLEEKKLEKREAREMGWRRILFL